MHKSADARKLDKKHVSPKTLKMLLDGRLQEALDRPDMQFLHAQEKERQRMLVDCLEDPSFYLQPEADKKPKPEEEGAPFPFGAAPPGSPAAPGTPQPPSTLSLGGAGMEQTAGILGHFMNKMAEEDESGDKTLNPEQVQDLVNFIVSQGQGIDDEDFHSKAEGMGVNTHSAEAEMYKLIASLVGGQNDIVPGGLAAGVPDSAFPPSELEAGTKVEMEHTDNPAVAKEIAKDHDIEGEDYYEPRLKNLEEEMEADVESGKTDAVGEGDPKVEANKDKVEQKVEKLDDEKAAAFKYGFLMKLAESGMSPSDLENEMRRSIEKYGSWGEAIGGGVKALAEILKTIIGGGIRQGSSAAKWLGLGIIPVLTGTAGYAGGKIYYDLTRPDDLTPADVKRAERLALYKRLTERAKSKTRKEKEPESLETTASDAHQKLIPATTGIEI